MTRTTVPVRRRARAALVVAGITLGILVLFFLQFALPYFIGPVGLLLAGLLDASLYLEFRHRRALRRRLTEDRRRARGPIDRRELAHAKRPLDDEFVLTIALIVFVFGFALEGVGLGADSWSPGLNLPLLIVGTVITSAAYMTMRSMGWFFKDPRSESEKYDTTDDH